MILYYHNVSPPCRAVMMTMKILEITPEIKIINLIEREHLTPEFMAINAEHLIPILDDDGFILTESRAIMKYLVLKYGAPNHPLYPSDCKEQAVIDKYLYFDQGTIFQRTGKYFFPLFEDKQIVPKYLESLKEGIGFLDGYLNGKKFVTGNDITLADISLSATVSEFPAFRIDYSSYKNVVSWLERCAKSLPGWDENEEGLKVLKTFMDTIFQQMENK